MIISLVELLPTRDSRQAMLEILRLAQRGARTKAACLGCDIYEAVDASHAILYLERWRSLEDLCGHVQSSIYLRVLNAMDLAAEQPIVSFHEVSDTKSMDLVRTLRRSE
jgi:quinol monooxygenase YgiN